MPTLDADHLVGLRNQGLTIEDVSFDQIETAIAALDGKTHTLVTVGQTDWSWIAVGGGSDGQYVVSATLSTTNDERHFVLRNPDAHDDEEDVPMSIGGQLTEIPRREVVDRSLALRVVRTFFTYGQLHPDLTWDEL